MMKNPCQKLHRDTQESYYSFIFNSRWFFIMKRIVVGFLVTIAIGWRHNESMGNSSNLTISCNIIDYSSNPTKSTLFIFPRILKFVFKLKAIRQ
jgi:hypothetical protein